MDDFIAFNQNAANNIVFLLTSNVWNVIFLVAVVGMIVLRLKAAVDEHVEEHVGII